MPLSPQTRDKLKTVSTATICTALFKRGFRNQFIQDVHPLNPNGAPMVGEAFTLRYIPAREDLNPLTVFQDRAHPQRKAVEECPPGAVFVIDSRKDPRAASAGSILFTRLMKRGVAGVVTDGGFRDSPEIARLAIPAYHNRPSAPTNLTIHQALDINVDRLRRRAGLARRRGRRRRRRGGGHPGPSRRRDRRRGGRDDHVRGFRHRGGRERPLDSRALPADGREGAQRLRRLAQDVQALVLGLTPASESSRLLMSR